MVLESCYIQHWTLKIRRILVTIAASCGHEALEALVKRRLRQLLVQRETSSKVELFANLSRDVVTHVLHDVSL